MFALVLHHEQATIGQLCHKVGVKVVI
jgi:hypothetical protein